MSAPLRLCVRRSAADPAGGATVVRVRLPSDVGCIEQAVELVTRHCLAGHPIPERTRFRLQVALSEALANAIVRGNHEDGAKWVDVEAKLVPDAIRVRITDEGPGFDPSAVPEPTGPGQVAETCGRGLYLIRTLVDEVEFNEQGNSICMTLRRL